MIQRFKQLKWWQVVLLSVIITALGGLSSMQSDTEDTRLYAEHLLQAPWSPPGWLFGPAWTFNNIFILLALQMLVSTSVPKRKHLLILQGCIWFIFFSFGYVYFNRRSPVLAAVWTIGDAILAITSFAMVFKNNRKLAFHYLPLILWTVFASTVAGYQALKNPDPVFKTGIMIT